MSGCKMCEEELIAITIASSSLLSWIGIWVNAIRRTWDARLLLLEIMVLSKYAPLNSGRRKYSPCP